MNPSVPPSLKRADWKTKAQEAAGKSVGSGKAGGVTTDYTKTGYEVTVTAQNSQTQGDLTQQVLTVQAKAQFGNNGKRKIWEKSVDP